MSAKIIVADDKAVVRIVPAAGAIERVTKIGALEHSGIAAIIGEIAFCGAGQNGDVFVFRIRVFGQSAGNFVFEIVGIHLRR